MDPKGSVASGFLPTTIAAPRFKASLEEQLEALRRPQAQAGGIAELRKAMPKMEGETRSQWKKRIQSSFKAGRPGQAAASSSQSSSPKGALERPNVEQPNISHRVIIKHGDPAEAKQQDKSDQGDRGWKKKGSYWGGGLKNKKKKQK